jgi:hypothetical protein
MKIFAYCAQSFESATRKAAGVQPLTCPPLHAEAFKPKMLSGHDFLYFDLHGCPGGTYWMGDYGIPAVEADTVRRADLRGAVVFATNCYLADEGSPMLDALLDAGARFVIGGDGQNWAGRTANLLGAGLLGWWVRRLMQLGLTPLDALALAKVRLMTTLSRARADGAAARDTLGFRAFYRPGGADET